MIKTTKKITRRIVLILNDIVDILIVNKLANKIKKNKNKRTLLINTSLIGDTLVSLPYYQEFISHTKKEITFLTSPSFKKIFTNSHINAAEVNIKNFRYNPFYRYFLIKKLGCFESIALIIPFYSDDMSYICKLIPSKNKITCAGRPLFTDREILKYKKIFNQLIETKLSVCHVKSTLNKIFELTDNHINNTNYKYQITGEIYIESMKSITPERTFFTHENYIVIMTDASAEYRRLEKNKWQNLLNMLPEEMKIVQLGISKMTLHHNNLVDLTNITTLQEALSIISNADLLIGNETGLTHFSYLSGKKTIMICGGGHYGLFFPWPEFKNLKIIINKMDCFHCDWKCKFVDLNIKKPPCIQNINESEIFNSIPFDELKLK